MARQRRNVTYQTGALLLLLLCATCLFASRTASSADGDAGVRAYGIVAVAKDTVKTFAGAAHRVADQPAPMLGDLPGALATTAFLLAGLVLTAVAWGRRRLLLTVVPSRAPPGGLSLR